MVLTVFLLIIIYIVITIVSLCLLYIDTYSKCKTGLINNSKENIERVCTDTMNELSWICFIPFINIIVIFVLSIMVLLDGLD